jgi:hopanoid biosynthesis associated protein HpnK
MNHLIINADDFGLSEVVNEAIERANRDGILTSASLMVGAPAAADAVRRARRLPGLRVGLHITLVDGNPVSDPALVAALVGRDGKFRNDLLRYAATLLLSASARRQMAREIGAQFEAYRATGLPLDHVNSHRHFHLHPAVAAATVELGRDFGMRALRIPFEPWRTIGAIEPGTQRQAGRVVAPWARLLRALVRRAGVVSADAVFGLAWSGAMTRKRVLALLERLPPGVVEIYFHPATIDNFGGGGSGYRHAEELATLLDPDCAAAVRRCGYSLGGYSDVVA